jgi:hypothetical protein
MSYTFKQLKEDVRKEAEALKIHATKEERERLDFSNLRPANGKHCIYGQMTGNCYSLRAAELIKISTPVYVNKIHEVSDNGIFGIKLLDIAEQDPFFIKNRTNNSGMGSRYSAIEAYILLPEANNAGLIAFLRGETENLEL